MIVEMRNDELRGLPGGIGIAWLAQYGASQRECRTHHAVPRGENLVIQMRANTQGPLLKELGLGSANLVRRAAGFLRGIGDGVRFVEDIFAREFAVRVVAGIDISAGTRTKAV